MALSTNTTVISNYLSSEYNLVKQISSLAYKNEISASEVCGYEDTKYTAGNGLKLEGTEFSISTDYIKRIETDGKLALSSLNDLGLGDLAYKDQAQISDVSDLDDKLNEKTTSAEVSSIAEGYVPKTLSSINDNEISNYVKNGINPVIIGKNNISAENNAIVIDTGSDNKNNGTTSIAFGYDPIASKTYSIAIGAGAHAYGAQSIAIGKSSTVNTNISSAIQLGWGTNNESNSLQFRNTQIVNSNGVIPNKSLELKSINGILSSDGNGRIVSADVKAVSIKDETKEDAEWKKSDLSVLKLPLSSYELSVIGGTISDNVLYITDSDYMDMYRCQICALTMPEEDGQVYEGVAATKTYVDSKIKEVKDKIVETTSEILNNILNKQMDEISIENIAEALSVLCKELNELD